jgi:urease accessory protein
MVVVDRIYREADLPGTARPYKRDTITLGWEHRIQAHGKRQSDGGLELALSLPRGTVLRGGDCLVSDDTQTVVAVVERPEAVFVIVPGSPPDWALYAYHVGNRHQPLMIASDGIVCPDMPGVEQVLQQYHIPYTRSMRPFTPASADAGHRH